MSLNSGAFGSTAILWARGTCLVADRRDRAEGLTAGGLGMRLVGVVAEDVEQLKALFREMFAGREVDLEVLGRLLGGAVEECEEGCGLD